MNTPNLAQYALFLLLLAALTKPLGGLSFSPLWRWVQLSSLFMMK